jgi:hypothetical protein
MTTTTKGRRHRPQVASTAYLLKTLGPRNRCKTCGHLVYGSCLECEIARMPRKQKPLP